MLLLLAIISIILALIFYVISIYQEIVKKRFTLKIVILFWIGIAFNVLGALLIMSITPGMIVDLHSVLGHTSLILMIVRALWSSMKYYKSASTGVPIIFTIISSVLWIIVFLMGLMQ